MAIVNLKIADYTYKISCADGQEGHIMALADAMNQKAAKLVQALGYIPEGQLLAMICILTAQEGYQAKTTQVPSEDLTATAQQIDQLSERIAQMTAGLKE